MQTSDSRNKWNYIIKNLIILDRAIDEGLFVYDIAKLKIDFVENFSDKDAKDSTSTLWATTKIHFNQIYSV